MARIVFVSLLLLSVAASIVSAELVDNNPCRNISIFDPWINGTSVFDLSALIDQCVPRDIFYFAASTYCTE